MTSSASEITRAMIDDLILNQLKFAYLTRDQICELCILHIKHGLPGRSWLPDLVSRRLEYLKRHGNVVARKGTRPARWALNENFIAHVRSISPNRCRSCEDLRSRIAVLEESVNARYWETVKRENRELRIELARLKDVNGGSILSPELPGLVVCNGEAQ